METLWISTYKIDKPWKTRLDFARGDLRLAKATEILWARVDQKGFAPIREFLLCSCQNVVRKEGRGRKVVLYHRMAAAGGDCRLASTFPLQWWSQCELEKFRYTVMLWDLSVILDARKFTYFFLHIPDVTVNCRHFTIPRGHFLIGLAKYPQGGL